MNTKIIALSERQSHIADNLLPVFNISFRLQRMSPGELSKAYGVSDKTFARWLKPFKRDLGKRQGQFYNPNQVRIIVSKLGIPDSELRE